MDRRLIVYLSIFAHLCAVSHGNSNFITQTVYGFLDFTTTLGNTVMVFSPQSAPPPEPPTTTTEKQDIDNIIETKPPPVPEVKPEAIKPSKLSDKENGQKAAPISSAVSVVSSSPTVEEKIAKNPQPVYKKEEIISKVEVVAGASKIVENVTPKPSPKPLNKKPKPEIKNNSNIISSKVEVKQAPVSIISSKLSSVVEIRSSEPLDDDEPAILVNNNNIGEPEYDFLSRQPSEFVEETYKVINIRPSKAPVAKPKIHKNKPAPTPPTDDEDDEHPIGLVTTLGGTIVRDGLTTVHETSVIGTYINGKYAQVLNSNSKILQPPGQKAKISPTPPHRILKTVGPTFNKNNRHNLEPTPSISDESSNESNFKSTRRPSSFKNRHNQRNQNSPEVDQENVSSNSNVNSNKKYKNRSTPRTPSETPPAQPSFSNRRKSNNRNPSYKSTITPSNSENQSRRGFKPRIQPSAVEHVTPAGSTSLYKFKLNRAPGSGRWQYKTSPKPKVTIRKMNGDDEPQTTPNPNPLTDDPQSNDISVQSRSDNSDLELQGSHSGPGSLIDNDPDDNSIEKPAPVETLKVEISTPADFKDVYYEIATIRSPYTFQVGRVKNTRIITVTSTFKKTIEPTPVFNAQSSLNEPLTENILATASPYGKDHNLDASIATLPPITLYSDMETPPLETFIETFSTTQHMLKTHILPVIKDNITNSLTFIQTYEVTRFVTATKTLPPMEYFQFNPSKTLKEFNSRLDEAGSELHLELDFGDSNEDDEGIVKKVFPADLDLANVGSDFDLTEIDKNHVPDNHLRSKKAHNQNSKLNQVTEAPSTPTPALTPEQAQQLALLRLLNPAAAQQIPDVVTTKKPVLKYETVYETHLLPFFDGKNTVHSTISRPVATITKTEYEIGTSNLPALPLQQINPLFPQQQQFTILSTPVVLNTEVAQTDSKILKLTFGAKTVYTTLYQTKVVPTQVTSYMTSQVPIAPSAGFPGYFPGQFAPFPYVG